VVDSLEERCVGHLLVFDVYLIHGMYREESKPKLHVY
jgi:hypothetical protein